jgi:biopolymer transport protein ExbD
VLDGIDGQAVRQVGSVKFVEPHARPGEKRRLGAGGMFHATFQAVEAGKATVSLAYRRPWEKSKDPARTFSVTIDVKPARQEQAAARAVTVTVGMADGKPQYTLLGKHPKQLTDLLDALKSARENGATEVLLDVGTDVPQKHLADVINVAKAAGFASVGMKASP